MAISPISWMSLNLGPQVGEDDAIVRVRVVPVRRDGRIVYARTLNAGEPDTCDLIHVSPGDTLVFPSGSMKVTIMDVDRSSVPSSDGYAPVANTVWSWLAVPPRTHPQAVHRHMFALARRLDMAHVHCLGALRCLADSSNQPSFLSSRAVMFEAHGHAESMCIALSRAIRMAQQAKTRLAVIPEVPAAVQAVASSVSSLRDAFEHIDERAQGKARREDRDDALSVFDQSDFSSSGVLRYAHHALDISAEALPAMVAARKFIVDVVVAADPTKTFTEEIRWTFTEDDAPVPIVSADAQS